ncbi:MAG: hypothetical protein IJG65_02675 [Synergistaceae bacterium]|nr:hypothetical protein [Synergistaceae bacterium]
MSRGKDNIKKGDDAKMATTLTKISARVNLNNGTDSSGNVKTVSLGLGTMSLTGYDAGKVYAISQLLAPCLTKTVYSVEEVRTSTITAA